MYIENSTFWNEKMVVYWIGFFSIKEIALHKILFFKKLNPQYCQIFMYIATYWLWRLHILLTATMDTSYIDT